MSRFITCTGQVIDLNRLDLIHIDLPMIVQSAVKVCRFNGHTRYHYSNLQHMYLTSCIAKEKELKIPLIIHDAHESIIGDIITPVAEYLGKDKIHDLKNQLDSIIAKQLGVPELVDPDIKSRMKYYDNQMTCIEAWHFFPCANEIYPKPEIHNIYIRKELNKSVVKKFLQRFKHLKKSR